MTEPQTDLQWVRAIAEASDEPDRFLNLLFAYYHDRDRADRTDRALIYLHLGMACGEIARLLENKRGAPGRLDTLTIVADTLRTMMGATAADPYIKAIERAVVVPVGAETRTVAELRADIGRALEKIDDPELLAAFRYWMP